MPEDDLLLRVLATLEDHGRRIAAIEKAIGDANEHVRRPLERDEAERTAREPSPADEADRLRRRWGEADRQAEAVLAELDALYPQSRR